MSHFLYEVIPTEMFRAGGGVLTYSSDSLLTPGEIVEVPLGKKKTLAIVSKKVKSVDFKTKDIIREVYTSPLPRHLVKSIFWLSSYYLSPLPATASLMIPPGITSRNFLKTLDAANVSELKLPLISLNAAQKEAVAALKSMKGNTKLLRGITGSGKTNIYLSLTSDTLKSGRSSILLVPEIALTSQLVAIFRETFGDRIVLIHSNQTIVERRNTWLEIMTRTLRGEPIVVVGPRSALLSPVHNLGMIIIDEAHENAYYQDNTPRYSAIRLASFIAAEGKIPCILGSATPNIVDYHLARTHGTLVELSEKAKSSAIEPDVDIIDLRDKSAMSKNHYFSNALISKIEHNLKENLQTLIFHNRRGSSPLTICDNCGWQALCPECYLPMTLHADTYRLCCHICGHEEKVPTTCPECGKLGIIHKGFGTKLLESELSRLFPEARIMRFDGDNKKGTSLADVYDEVKSGKIDILVGTQTLARGLDLPHLATVGIVQADAGLSLPDFSSEERTFELLTQVIGRVGRGHLDEASVIVQTYQPDHPVIETAIRADFNKFADFLLESRRQGHLPPFSYLARLSVTYKTEKTTIAKIQLAYKALSKVPGLKVSPPIPAFHERTSRGFTWQIIIKSASRKVLLDHLRPYSETQGYSLVLDPPSLL